ncbi:hypothetical protein PSP6_260015 [Paraburkholderia tropica]|nr:hypothetical protein PSP6_260015 [Paraburkholderia tropica]
MPLFYAARIVLCPFPVVMTAMSPASNHCVSIEMNRKYKRLNAIVEAGRERERRSYRGRRHGQRE